MKSSLILFGLITVMGFSTNAQTVNESESFVEFTVANKKKEVTGTIKGMSGDVTFLPEDLVNASIDVCIDPATINTENNMRDKHLKSKDYFHVEDYPTICFKSSKIEASGEGYIATGTLTMHGVTKEVQIQLTYQDETLQGNFEVNRVDYGVGPDGDKMVGHNVTLLIICKLK